MISPRWRKVWRDLWGSKTRTALVVLSIAVGVFAVGTIASTQTIVLQDLAQVHAAAHAPHATLSTELFDDDLVASVRRVPGVQEAEGRRHLTKRLEIGPDEWRDVQLYALADYTDIRLNQIWPERGAWPPPRHELLVERAVLPAIKKNIGDTVRVGTPNGKQRELRIAGLVHDVIAYPAPLTGGAYGYISQSTLEWLGEPSGYNELYISVAGNPRSQEEIRGIADQVRDRVENSGRKVLDVSIPEPGWFWTESMVRSTIFLLGALGFFALLLSGFLVINTMTALLKQQVRQIGIMKALGARTRPILEMYLAMVFAFGLLALGLAMPLGALGAFALTHYAAALLNFDITSSSFPPGVLALEAAISLVVPLLAALFPILAGTRVTVREAMNDYGIAASRGPRSDHRVSLPARWLPRPLLLSLRNTFRRKQRMLLTLCTLSLGGALFIAVLSVQASLVVTTNDTLNYFNYDVGTTLTTAYSAKEIEHDVLQVPGVLQAETWSSLASHRVRPDKNESANISVIALPAATRMVQPLLLAGRWLLPEDEDAVVITTDLQKEEPDLQVGDSVILKIEGRERTLHAVGLVRGVWFQQPTVYVNYPYLAHLLPEGGRANIVQVVTERHDPAFQLQVARKLEDQLQRNGKHIASTQTTTSLRASILYQFNILVVFLLMMAVLLGLVGGLGLMGTMSINVLERTRELGVMRAIGATHGAVLQIVMVEGIAIGVYSWLIGTVLALPLSKFLSDVVGVAFIRVPLHYVFAPNGVLTWLLAVVVISALATFLPAQNALRLSVRAVLVYE